MVLTVFAASIPFAIAQTFPPTFGYPYGMTGLSVTSITANIKSNVSGCDTCTAPVVPAGTPGLHAPHKPYGQPVAIPALFQFAPQQMPVGLVSFGIFGPVTTAFQFSMSGGPVALYNCSATPGMNLTQNGTSLSGVSSAGSSWSVSCSYSLTDAVDALAAIYASLSVTGPTTPSGPTSVQQLVTINYPEWQNIAWNVFPPNAKFTYTKQYDPHLIAGATPKDAFLNAATIPGCNGNEVYACHRASPPAGPTALYGVASGKWLNNNQALECTLGKTKMTSTNPAGAKQEIIIEVLAFGGDVSSTGTIHYPIFNTYPNAPKQTGALNAYSNGVKAHEDKHAQDIEAYFADYADLYKNKLKNYTIDVIKREYGLLNGKFSITGDKLLPYAAITNASQACQTAVTDAAFKALGERIGAITDAYARNAQGNITDNLKTSVGDASSIAGKMEWRSAFHDESQRGNLCFYASEATPPAGDPVNANGCIPGSISGTNWISRFLSGVVSFVQSSQLIYTQQ
jgi:hypothetical protein